MTSDAYCVFINAVWKYWKFYKSTFN